MAPPLPSLLRALRTAQSRVFQTAPPLPESVPVGTRTGARVLRKRLVGPSMLRYYPSLIDLPALRRAVPEVDRAGVEAPLMTPEEVQRQKDVARKKSIGKGPPKKGEGRRAAMKSKGRK